jgi:hypothetical protein
MKKLTYICVILLAFGLISGTAFAQTASARLVGKVTDDEGIPLPGVTVEAESPRLVGSSSTVTDEEGSFRIFALPSGTYTVVFKLPGFNTVTREGIFVQLEQTINITVTLTPSAIEEEVTVLGQSPIIDVKSTVKGRTITRELFQSLPKGRDFTGLLSIIPSVHYESNTGGLSVDGATGTENMWYVDGTDVTNMHIGTQAQNAVFELVDEVQVKASGYPAEYGGSMGGVVNVITRAGGNEFHGDVVGYYNDESQLMYGKARDYLRVDPYDDNVAELVNDDDLYYDGGKARDTNKRFEGIFSLGGYILRDRLWFFGSFNPIFRKEGGPRFFLDAADPDAKSDFFIKRWNWNGQFKLTSQPLTGLRVSASFVNNFYKYRGTLPSRNGTSTFDYPYADYGYDYPNWSTNATMDYSIGNNLLLSGRAGYFYTNTTNQQLKPEDITQYRFSRSNFIYEDEYNAAGLSNLLHYSGWYNYSGTDFVYEAAIKDRFISNVDVNYYTYLAGEHSFKAGVQFIRLHENQNAGNKHPRVSLYWGRGTDVLASGERVEGTYGYYQIRGGFTSEYGDLWNIHSNNWALYLQDSWTIGDKLTLQLGVRTESEYIPSFNDAPEYKDVRPVEFGFGDKLAPRIGAIYDVFGDSNTKVFANFAIYYDVMKLYMAEGAYGGFKWKTDYYELNDLDFTKIASNGDLNDAANQAGNGANRYVGTMDWRIPSFDSTDPGMKPVGQREITVGLEQKLMEELSLSVRFVQKHLIRTIEDVGVETLEGEKYFNGNPGFGWTLPIAQGGKFSDKYWPTPKAKREYYGLNISLDKRFSNNWQGGINYTWSRVAGNYSGLSSSDEGGRNSPNVERNYDLWFLSYDLQGNVLDGPLQHDRTHYIKAYGSYAFPFGLTVGLVAYGRSGLPLTEGLSLNNVNVYPNNRANLGRLPFTAWGDIYLEYNLRFAGRYRAQINLQVNNFTNTDTWQSKDTTPNRATVRASDDEILSKNFDYKSKLATGDYDPDPRYGQFLSKFGRWYARLGFRFSF